MYVKALASKGFSTIRLNILQLKHMLTYLILGPCTVTNKACPTPNKAIGIIAKFYFYPNSLSLRSVIELCTISMIIVAATTVLV